MAHNLVLNCLTCFREQKGTESCGERYGNLSRADCGNILQCDSATSSSLAALQQPHYGSVSNLATQQSSQHYSTQQQLRFVSNGTASQSVNTLVPQQLSHYGSASNITAAQFGSPVRQHFNYSTNIAQQHVHYTSTRNVSVTASQQFSSVSTPALTQQGKSNIHNTFPAAGSELLPHQNETELLVKEIAMLNFNQVWNERASKAKPGEFLHYEPSGSSSLSLVPYSSNVSGSVTSVSHQQMFPFGENSLTSVSAGFSGVSTVCSNSQSAVGIKSTVMQETRSSGVSTEKHFPPSSGSLCSQFQQHGISPGKQIAGLHS
jgi:hypothetical protein